MLTTPNVRQSGRTPHDEAAAPHAGDATTIRTLLRRAEQRVAINGALRGSAIGIAIMLLAALAGVPARGATFALAIAGVFGVLAGGALGFIAARRTRAAYAIEARAPECRNVLITAAELLDTARANGERGAAAVAPYALAMVAHDAANVARRLDLRRLFPRTRDATYLAMVALAFVLVAARDTLPLRVAERAIASVAPASTASIDDIALVVTAPAYAARSPERLRNPARVEALAGSTIRLSIRSTADSLDVQTLSGVARVGPSSAGLFIVDRTVDVDGFVSLAPRLRDGRDGAARWIGVTVLPDAVPRVRIVTPSGDVRLRDGKQTLSVGIEAEDDIGVASLRLRFTRVSGSGERFTFTDGDVPLTVVRRDARHWSASVRWPLDTLALTPGDMVVYRAITKDTRPGSAPQESDARIAEVIAPGSDAAAGFAIDPDQERYAVSQQMVILKTERLIARRASMSDDSATVASQEIAAEQRKVRSEFVFMMGGELEDAPSPDASMTELNEVAEAEAEDDILAGRLANQGRVSLARAIRLMSRAQTLLTVADLAPALAAEKSALAQIELAFSRTRIILRALSEREALDLSRRLSGTLTEARSASRAILTPLADPARVALRRALADVAQVLREVGTSRELPSAGDDVVARQSARLAQVAQQTLRIDPANRALQDAAARLSDASAALARNRGAEVGPLLDAASSTISALLRNAVTRRAAPATPGAERELRAALGEAERRASRGAKRDAKGDAKPTARQRARSSADSAGAGVRR